MTMNKTEAGSTRVMTNMSCGGIPMISTSRLKLNPEVPITDSVGGMQDEGDTRTRT